VVRGPLFDFIADDHVRLAGLLQQAKADPETIDYGTYAEFRAGLLKHIAIEEKILLPAARRLRGGELCRSPISCAVITARLPCCWCQRPRRRSSRRFTPS
jgi:hypothetical protein